MVKSSNVSTEDAESDLIKTLENEESTSDSDYSDEIGPVPFAGSNTNEKRSSLDDLVEEKEEVEKKEKEREKESEDKDDQKKEIKVDSTHESLDVKVESLEESTRVFGFPLQFGKRSWKERSESTSLESSKTDGQLLRSIIKESKERKKPLKNSCIQKQELESEPVPVCKEDIPEVELLASNINDPFFIPVMASTHFSAHQKSVTALVVDPSETLLITGGNDSEVAMWDFHKMNAKPKPFKRFIPVAGHSIRSFSCSFDGDHFVCAAGDAIGRAYTMTGKKVQETVKGDMYVRDLAQTVGHTHTVNDCVWHPTQKNKFFLSSSDATIRIFDLTAKPYGVDQALPHVHILKAVDKRNLNIAAKCRVTALAVAPVTGKYIIGGCSDGSLQFWNEQKIYGKPNKIIRKAHAEESEITSIVVLSNETQMITRSMDNTMKLWDVRLFKEPSHVWSDLPNKSSNLRVCLSPNENMVATGISSDTKSGFVAIYDVSGTYEKKHSIEVTRIETPISAPDFPISVPAISWPTALNQIIIGASDGFVRIWYDPQVSQEGALLFLNRPVYNDEVYETFSVTPYIPEELPPGFKQTRSGEIRKVRIRPEEVNVQTERKIQPPLPEECQSRVGMASTMLGRSNEKDLVESLRSYAEIAEKEPIFINKAYAKTQPVNILDYSLDGGDDEKLITGVNKCPRCGLKLCQCGFMRLSRNLGDIGKRSRQF